MGFAELLLLEPHLHLEDVQHQTTTTWGASGVSFAQGHMGS